VLAEVLSSLRPLPEDGLKPGSRFDHTQVQALMGLGLVF
jgi:hypothetical protein